MVLTLVCASIFVLILAGAMFLFSEDEPNEEIGFSDFGDDLSR